MQNNFEFKHSEKTACMVKNLPYTLTDAQREFGRMSLGPGQPLCNEPADPGGDVGSGRPLSPPWLFCMLLKTDGRVHDGAHRSAGRTALREFKTAVGNENHGIKIELLTGAMTAKEKRLAYERIENHDVDIIVGTHAVIQDKVNYDHLALVITDEQHRFGCAKGKC